MALMMGALYDALKSANVDDEKARKAAEEVAGFETRIASIDSRLAVLQWMLGSNIALTLIVLGKLFVVGP
jgi:hypothetical protein